MGEGGEISSESRRPNEAVHLGTDALHLGQAERVDFARCARGRRLNLDVVRVPGRSVWECVHADRLSRPRDVRIGQVGLQALECRAVLLVVSAHRIGAQTRSVTRGDSGREPGEGGKQRALHWIFGNQILHLPGNIAQRDSRWRYAEFYTAVEQGNRLVDDGWQRAQAGDYVGVILDGLRRHRADGRRGRLRSAQL